MDTRIGGNVPSNAQRAATDKTPQGKGSSIKGEDSSASPSTQKNASPTQEKKGLAGQLLNKFFKHSSRSHSQADSSKGASASSQPDNSAGSSQGASSIPSAASTQDDSAAARIYIRALNQTVKRSDITISNEGGNNVFFYTGEKIPLTEQEYEEWKGISELSKLEQISQRGLRERLWRTLFVFDKMLTKDIKNIKPTFRCKYGIIERPRSNDSTPVLQITLNTGDVFYFGGYYRSQRIALIRYTPAQASRTHRGIRTHKDIFDERELPSDVLNELKNFFRELEPMGEHLIGEFKLKFPELPLLSRDSTMKPPTKISLWDLEELRRVNTAEKIEEFRKKYTDLLKGDLADLFLHFYIQEALNASIEKYFEPNVNAEQIKRYLPILVKVAQPHPTSSQQSGIPGGQCGVKMILAAAAVHEGGGDRYKNYLNILKELETSTDPEVQNAAQALNPIHEYFNKVYGLKEGDLKYTLDEVIEQLKGYTDKATIKFAGEDHTMGIIIEKRFDGKLLYRFVDFDGTWKGEVHTIEADNLETLKSKLEAHFTPERLSTYGVYNGKFECKLVSSTFLSSIPVFIPTGKNGEGYFLISGQIATSKDVKSLISEAKGEYKKVKEILRAVKGNKRDYYFKLQNELVAATSELYKKNRLDSQNDILNFGTIQEVITKLGKKFRIAVYNTKYKTTRYIETSNAVFKKVQQYISKEAKEFKTYVQGLRNRWDLPMPGLNTAFGIMYFIELSNVKEDKNISEALKTAVRVHLWSCIGQNVHGTVEDAAMFAQLVQKLRTPAAGEKVSDSVMSRGLQRFTSQRSAPVWMKHFGRFGYLLNAASLGLDGYFLYRAETGKDKMEEEEKRILRIQLAFTMMSTAAGLISGPVGLLMGGTGALVTHVMRSQLSTNKELKRTERYFAQLKKAYAEAYKNYSESNALGFPEGAVIRRLDLTKKRDQIEFGTQKLYTSKKGSQEDDGKKENAISIREAVGGQSTHTIKEEDLKKTTIILPGVPQSYISCKMVRNFTTSDASIFNELFAVPKQDSDGALDDIGAYKHMPKGNEFKAYSTFRHLEGTAHYRVGEVSLTPEKTDVEVILPEEERTLLVPEGQGMMHYQIRGNGKQCKVVLNNGSSLELSSKKATTWFLDAREVKKTYFSDTFDKVVADDLKPSDIKWTSGKITFGDVEVQLDESNFKNNSELYVQTSYALLKIDLDTLRGAGSRIFTVLSADAGIWQDVEDYLKKNPEKHNALEQKYIPINHYDRNGEHFHGNAYYDVENKRMLFTSKELQNDIDEACNKVRNAADAPVMSAFSLQEGSLGPVVGEDVYFYCNSKEDKKRSQIWRVDAKNGKIKDWYHLPKLGVPDNMKMWQENGRILFSRANGNIFEISENQKIKLVKSQRDVEDVKTISAAHSNFNTKAEGGIYHFQRKSDRLTLSKNEEIHVAEQAQIYGKDKQGKVYTYYVENKNGEWNLVSPQLPISALENAQHLVLCHTEENKYFFFDSISKTLYLQIGKGMPSSPASVTQIGSQISHVMSSNGNLFATTEEGLIYQVDENGKLKVELLPEKWLEAQGSHWLQKLKNLPINSSKVLPIQGLMGLDKKPLSAWYYQGQLIFSPNITTENLQFIHVEENYAYLFDAVKAKLYKQPIASEQIINSAFGNGKTLLDIQQITPAKEFLENIKEVSKKGGLIQVITQEGAILQIDNLEQPFWVGVDKTWEANHTWQSSLSELSRKWTSPAKVIFIETDNDKESKWFDFNSRRWITAPISPNEHPQYLGIHMQTEKGYSETYYINSKKGVHGFTYSFPSGGIPYLTKEEKIENIEFQRIEDTLLITGGNGTLKPLLIENIKSTILYGGSGEDTYIIKKQDREKISHFTINNFDKERKSNKLQLELKDYYHTRLSRIGDDLIIADQKGTVKIENVFGPDKEDYHYLELQLTFEDNPSLTKTYQLSEVVQTLEGTLDDPETESLSLPLSILAFKVYSFLTQAA